MKSTVSLIRHKQKKTVTASAHLTGLLQLAPGVTLHGPPVKISPLWCGLSSDFFDRLFIHILTRHQLQWLQRNHKIREISNYPKFNQSFSANLIHSLLVRQSSQKSIKTHNCLWSPDLTLSRNVDHYVSYSVHKQTNGENSTTIKGGGGKKAVNANYRYSIEHMSINDAKGREW